MRIQELIPQWPYRNGNPLRRDEGDEEIVISKEDTARTFGCRISCVRNREGQPVSQVVVMNDITARKQAEEALREIREQLEIRVRERTIDLEETNRRLKKEITDRIQAERGLVESEQKYRTLFEGSIEAMSVSGEKKIVDVNPAWLRLHGFQDKQEVCGRDVMDFIFKEDKDIIEERRQRWPEVSDSIYQLRDMRKDGSAVEVEVYSTGLVYSGQPSIFTTVRDITELKRAEREKAALEARLLRSEKMEAIGTLAGGVAHDLNNILSGLVGYPELILMDLPATPFTRRRPWEEAERAWA